MKAVVPILLVLLVCFSAAAQQPVGESAPQPLGVNSLWEVRDMRTALLVVFKSRVLDVTDRERAIIQDVLKANPHPKGRYRWVYTQLAKKLNKYINKYGSLIAARELSDADYVIFFNVVEFRRVLDTPLSLRGIVCDRQRFSRNAKTAARRLESQENAVCRRRYQRSNQRPQSPSRRKLGRRTPRRRPRFATSCKPQRVKGVQLFGSQLH